MKYKIRKDLSLNYYDRTLYRIEALKDFSDVKAGDIGGYIENEENLSQAGHCWIYDNAKVFDNAEVWSNARVFGNAIVSGNAEVCGNARVCGNAKVYGIAVVYGNAIVYDNAIVYGNAIILNNKALAMLNKDTITANYIYRWTSLNSYIEHLSLNCTYEEAKDLMSEEEFKLWKEVFNNSLVRLK